MTEQNATSYSDLEHVMVMCRIFVVKVSFRIWRAVLSWSMLFYCWL